MKQFKKIISSAVVAVALLGSVANASVESKTWDASDKAKKFVKDTVVIGFLASPYGAGWTKDEDLLDYFEDSREAGITGHSMTLAATSYNWDQYLNELKIYRKVMAKASEKYTFVTSWGLQIVDELVKYGIIVDLSHLGSKTANGIMDHMDKNHPGVPYVYTHSLPAGLYKNTPKATKRGCYRNISDADALRAAKSGGYVSPTFTEWMMDGIWPEDITPQQAADMIDYYVKLVGIDHVGIASDDMFTTAPTMDFVAKNANMYTDDGYMTDAFDIGATGCGELSKILAAVTDELWKRGYSNEDIAKIYGKNKMRVYKQVWEGQHPEQFNDEYKKRLELREELKTHFMSR